MCTTSPREEASANQLTRLQGLESGMGTPTFDFEGTLRRVLGGLDISNALMTSGLSANIGEQLSGAGVPSGQPRSEAYISALAPVYAKTAETKALTTSDLSKFFATNQLDARKLLMMLMGQESEAIGGMKGSSTTGDILGGVQGLGNLLPSLLQILFPGTFGIDTILKGLK